MTVWYPEYVKFIDEMRTEPFEWGTNDCGPAWAGRLVEIVTGENPVKHHIGTYKTPRGALGKMKRLGFNDLKEATETILERDAEHPSRAALGDLALIREDTPFGYAFGVVNGERIFFRSETGLGTKDLLEAECIFKL